MRDAVIGDPNEMEEDGKIAYERLARARPNGRGARCYTAGLTFQKPKQMTAPAATMKRGLSEPMDLPKLMFQVRIILHSNARNH